jgi:hypothetical protein
MEGRKMFQYRALLAGGVVCIAVLIGSCKKDESQPTTPVPQGPQLTAVPLGVTVGLSQSQNVTITGGTHPYTVAQPPNGNLASAQFVNANLDTAVLVITGVSMATGATSMIVRDATTPQQKSVAVGILKVQ